LVRAADSVGANIAESYGRYHYAERIHFFYYAHGSAYETIYWLKRAGKRGLLPEQTVEGAVIVYTELIALINGVIKTTNQKRVPAKRRKPEVAAVAESRTDYILADDDETVVPF
jgi:four helix bundle protein